MLRFLTGVLLCLLFTGNALAQKKVTLSGYIKDSETGEGLISATVLVRELGTGTTTNEYGFYSLSLDPGTYTIEFSYTGYAKQSEQINLQQNITKNIELGFSDLMLNVVEITGEKEDANITSVEMSVEKMDVEVIKKIPQLLGEADIIRSIQLLPGVTTVGEGATGFNVRGGNIDQNLILLDESPIFSSSHLFGFFSVFNADAVKDVKLYKGGIPAKYGGRLSSVLDIRQKEGNMKKFSGSGGVGLLFSRLTLEGPILKDKVSYIISGRRSYFDIFLPLAPEQEIRDSRLYFYDLNGKINWTINDNNRIFVAGYFGDDVFQFADFVNTRWGNRTGTVRWNHLFSEKVFSNFTGIYSDYSYELGMPEGALAFEWGARIENYSLKADFSFFPNPKNTVEFGWHTTYYKFSPGTAQSLEGSDFEFQLKMPVVPAVESALYLSNEQKIGTRLTLAYGMRYSAFAQIGESRVFEYPNGQPVDPEEPYKPIAPSDTTFYGAGEIVESYHGLEPRFSFNYQLDEFSSVKGSYNRMRQYIHLISNTTSSIPFDIYMPAGKYIKPAIADQVGLGYFRNFHNNAYESSVEVYYKQFYDLVDYKDAAELLLNETLETELLSGDGRAYGLELQVKRNKGRLTGWISYTLSRVDRKVEHVNEGERYPANWDKTHDVSLVLSYDLTPRWNFAGSFAYMTGRPITYPDGRFSFGGITAPVYSNRNGARTPAYHRLDLSGTCQVITKEELDWLEADIAFGAYNVYARKNPYSISFRQDEDNPQITRAYQLSIYGTIIPYITVNFRF